jgi:hypothetical protein
MGASGWGETGVELVGRSLAAVVLIPPIPMTAMESAYAGFADVRGGDDSHV